MGRRDRAVRAVAARASPSRRRAASRGDALVEAAQSLDVVVTSYDIATRDVDDARRDRVGPAAARRGAGRQEPGDEARARAAPAARAAAGRDDGHADREPARRAVGDHGHRQPGPARLARVVRPHVRAADRGASATSSALERLRAIVQPFVLRRAKDAPEVELELPPITIEKDYCRLTVEQASLYQRDGRPLDAADRGARGQLRPARRGARDAQPAEAGVQPPGAAAARPGSRSTAAPGSSSGSSSCCERGARRATRRSSSRSTRASTGSCRTSRSGSARSVGFFHGRLNARQRDEVLTRVRDARTGRRVLVISIKAGGRGLNLPAANHVFHFDRWWNPAVEQQATDRVHRFGQRKPVFVHSLICIGTLEERIDALLESKRELAEKVIARPLRGLARRPRPRRDPRRRRARRPTGWRSDGQHERRRPRDRAAARGRGSSRARSCATKARRSPSAAARSCAREPSAPVGVGRERSSASVDGCAVDDHRGAGAAAHLGRDDALRARQPPRSRRRSRAARSRCISST